MRSSATTNWLILSALVLMLAFFVQPLFLPAGVTAQEQPAVETTATEPPPPTNTSTPTATFTPTATNTPPPEITNTPSPTATIATPVAPTPPDDDGRTPVPIPEPVTVVLFGTGLAALSAAVAARRRKTES